MSTSLEKSDHHDACRFPWKSPFALLQFDLIGAQHHRRRHDTNTASISNLNHYESLGTWHRPSNIMTDRPGPLSLPYPVPSQTIPTLPAGPIIKDEVTLEVDTVEEEPYTIKCICNFSDDDGNTILCETCDTWQHIECFYPNNREEALRPDFLHSCAECKPRPLDRQKAIERTLRLKNPAVIEGQSEKKPKRPPSKSHKKKLKLSEVPANGVNGTTEHGNKATSVDLNHPVKKAKPSHKSSQSISHQSAKRSPSQGNSRSNPTHPHSPATTPPNLPDGFQIHHYSSACLSLSNETDTGEAQSNAFASLAIPTALSRWLRDPDKMKQEVGRTHSEVFQDTPIDMESGEPKIRVESGERFIDSATVLRWRYLRSTQSVKKDVPLVQLYGEIGFQKDYCANADNLWATLSSPLPFVFFHPALPLYIDTRKEGSSARYVRRSCKPNAQLDTFLVRHQEYHFWLVSDRHIDANEQITLPWEFRLDKSVRPRWLSLLGLSDEPESAGGEEPEMDEPEYLAISNWIDRILSEYGGCACDQGNNCAFAQFHRRYLAKNTSRAGSGKKKPSRKARPHTQSPTSASHATYSRAESEVHGEGHGEGHGEDGHDDDSRSQSGSSRSKPPSRDPTPLRQGSFDQLGIITGLTDRDKRKVAMVEDSFRRMELQQQPPRKKKRASDGTTISTSSRSKHRHGSMTSQGQYVDAGTCRSKSGSPMTTQSPQFSTASAKSPAFPPSEARVTRQVSASVRPIYCDAGIQTDPVEGAWYNAFEPSPNPKKKIIPLCRRLMRNRLQFEEDQNRRHPLTPRTSSGSAMDLDSPLNNPKPVVSVREEVEQIITSQPMCSPVTDTPMTDALIDAPTHSPTDTNGPLCTAAKSPDLRVHVPPVPAFDNMTTLANSNTPLSATASTVQSPLSNTLPTPLGPAGVNNSVVHPSPAKKKLSLSDYTKRSKAAGKVVGGNTIIKQTLPYPEDLKVDIAVDVHIEERLNEETNSTTTAPSMNGHL